MTRVELATVDPVAVGARIYRLRGRRLLAVVVKASYALQPHGEMAPLPPMPFRTRPNALHPGDEPFPLSQSEVVIGPPAPAALQAGREMALTISRGPAIVLDVRRRVGDEGARDAAVGFGPVASASPSRARCAPSMDPAVFLGVRELQLDPRFDPTFFQCAPAPQRLEELCGGDVVVLLGMSHVVRAIQSTLPKHKGHAVVQVDSAPAQRMILRLDRLYMAPDALVAETSFRGMVEIPADASVIRILGGLETATRSFAPLPFSAVRLHALEALAEGVVPAAADEAPPPTQVLAATPRHGGTLVMSEPSGDAAPHTSKLEDGPHTAKLDVVHPFERTAVTQPDRKAPSSLPFQRGPRAAKHAPTAPIPGAPWDTSEARNVVATAPSDERAPDTVVLGEEPLDLGADLEPLPSVETAPTERQPAPPPAAVPEAPVAARPRREKVDPWRKDPEPAEPKPALPPPPQAKASPTRPDISGGLYKKFKR